MTRDERDLLSRSGALMGRGMALLEPMTPFTDLYRWAADYYASVAKMAEISGLEGQHVFVKSLMISYSVYAKRLEKLKAWMKIYPAAFEGVGNGV